MVALRLTYGTETRNEFPGFVQDRYPQKSTSRGHGRRGMLVEAMAVDAWQQGRIERAMELRVEQLSNDGLEVWSSLPLSPGRRLSLSFPASPFLPASGTIARVERCIEDEKGYRLELTYEAPPAA